MNQKPRPAGKLIAALMDDARAPVTAKGGFGQRMRRQQGLLLEAALLLARWGRPAKGAKQPDMFKQAPPAIRTGATP